MTHEEDVVKSSFRRVRFVLGGGDAVHHIDHIDHTLAPVALPLCAKQPAYSDTETTCVPLGCIRHSQGEEVHDLLPGRSSVCNLRRCEQHDGASAGDSLGCVRHSQGGDGGHAVLQGRSSVCDLRGYEQHDGASAGVPLGCIRHSQGEDAHEVFPGRAIVCDPPCDEQHDGASAHDPLGRKRHERHDRASACDPRGCVRHEQHDGASVHLQAAGVKTHDLNRWSRACPPIPTTSCVVSRLPNFREMDFDGVYLEVPGDGNCVYHALALLTDLNEDWTQKDVRHVLHWLASQLEADIVASTLQMSPAEFFSKVDAVSVDGTWGNEVSVLLWAILVSTRVLVIDCDSNQTWLFEPLGAQGNQAHVLRVKNHHCEPGLFPVDLSELPLTVSHSVPHTSHVAALARNSDRAGRSWEGPPPGVQCFRMQAGVVVGGTGPTAQTALKEYELALSLAKGAGTGLSMSGLKTILKGSPGVVKRVNRASSGQAIAQIVSQAAELLAEKVKKTPPNTGPGRNGLASQQSVPGSLVRSKSEPPKPNPGNAQNRANNNSTPPSQPGQSNTQDGKWHVVAPRKRAKCSLELCDQFNAQVVKDLFPGQHGVLLCPDRETLVKVHQRMRDSPGLVGIVTPQDYKIPGLTPRSTLVQVRKLVDGDPVPQVLVLPTYLYSLGALPVQLNNDSAQIREVPVVRESKTILLRMEVNKYCADKPLVDLCKNPDPGKILSRLRLFEEQASIDKGTFVDVFNVTRHEESCSMVCRIQARVLSSVLRSSGYFGIIFHVPLEQRLDFRALWFKSSECASLQDLKDTAKNFDNHFGLLVRAQDPPSFAIRFLSTEYPAAQLQMGRDAADAYTTLGWPADYSNADVTRVLGPTVRGGRMGLLCGCVRSPLSERHHLLESSRCDGTSGLVLCLPGGSLAVSCYR
eukprot:6473726-Amphidinium_carterae.3